MAFFADSVLGAAGACFDLGSLLFSLSSRPLSCESRRYWENKRTAIRQKEKQIEELQARYDTELP